MTGDKIAIKDAAGKNAGQVTAVAPKDTPNEWQIDKVEATQKSGTGSAAFRRLFKSAQDEATRTGKPVTVRNGGVATDEMKNLWESSLKKQGYEVKGDTVTLKPKARPSQPATSDWTQAVRNAEMPESFMSRAHGIASHASRPEIEIPDREWQQ